MKIYYVIKNPISNSYLTFIDGYGDFLKAKTFDNKEEAIEEIVTLDGHFIIEKVYNL
jgi:hypothetical protein